MSQESFTYISCKHILVSLLSHILIFGCEPLELLNLTVLRGARQEIIRIDSLFPLSFKHNYQLFYMFYQELPCSQIRAYIYFFGEHPQLDIYYAFNCLILYFLQLCLCIYYQLCLDYRRFDPWLMICAAVGL